MGLVFGTGFGSMTSIGVVKEVSTKVCVKAHKIILSYITGKQLTSFSNFVHQMMKLALPIMRKQAEGLIINVTSGSGRFSFPFSVIYGASKFDLEGLSEGLNYEVKP